MHNSVNKTSRYNLIDAIRGIAIINMVVFHFLYDVFVIFTPKFELFASPLVFAWEQFICITFIIVSGISFNFTKHGYKNGIKLNLFGFLITAVTVIFLSEQAIWFGILNFLGCAMLIMQPLRIYTEKIPPFLGAVLSLVLFLIFYGVPKGYIGIYTTALYELPDFLYQCKYLAFLGFPSVEFSSTDYFAIIPWLFLFVFGYFLWRVILQNNLDKYFSKNVPPFAFVGRHSLLIYIIHQPICMLICYIVASNL